MLIAKPFDWTVGDPTRLLALLDRFATVTSLVPYPYSADERRQIGAATLTNPANLVYEAWQDGQSVGVLLLDRIVPRVDARLHFFFLNENLASKQTLLVNFLGFCFRDLEFYRISVEIPDGMGIEKFLRRKLGFRYEGETRPRHLHLHDSLSARWVASQGSRREAAHFEGTGWRDVLLLRLLAPEWETQFGGDTNSAPPRRGNHAADDLGHEARSGREQTATAL